MMKIGSVADKVLELEKEYGGDAIIFIGSGSSYIYIGELSKANKALEYHDNEYHDLLDASINECEKTISRCQKELKYKRNPSTIRRLEEIMDTAKRKIVLIKRNSEKWAHLMDRDVISVDVEHNPSAISATIRLIFDGFEHGKVWFEHEYKELYGWRDDV